tara:strand:- start:3196 stop:5175 length:1980 start_codon:yes stop_codon:yes gene_type:complete
VATRADIEIAVKGIRKLEEAKKQIRDLNKEINKSNKQITKQAEKEGAVRKGNKTSVGAASQVRSINTLNKQLSTATRNFNRVALGTDGAAKAAIQLKKAQDALNLAYAQQNDLLGKNVQAQGAFSRISDKQSRNAAGQRTRMNNPIGRGMASLGATQGFDTQSALISGAFPLLFGQGPVGAAAGALGGGIGGMFGGMGGFAGGIAATALVQSIQSALDAISKLGQAMGPFTQNTQAVTDALGLQGSAEESRLKLIEQTQGKTAAFNASMRLMATEIGQRGVDALKQFGENTRLLTSSFTLAITKLQAFAAGVANFVARLTGLQASLEAGAATRTVAAAAGEGDEQAQALVNRRNAAESMKSRGGEGRRKKQLLEEISAEEQIFAIRRNTSIEADNLTQKFDGLKTSIEAEAEETKRIVELRRDGLNPALAKTIAGIEKEGSLAKDALQVEIDKLLEKQKLEAILGEKDQTRLTTLEGIKNKIDEQVDSLSEAATATDKLNESTKDIKSNFEKIGESIASGVSDNLVAAIQGTKSLGDAAKSILNDLSSSLIRLGVNTILGGIPGFGGLLGFASGGNPPVGKPSIVGEKGPELFVPKRSGTIIPNDKLGGGGSTNISVNVDASGSSVQGDEQQSKELGRAISAAIQSELLKQRRPGGLLR